MTQSGRVVKMPNHPSQKPSIIQDPRLQQTVQNYEAGLKALHERKFDKAKGLFEKVIAGPSKELADRAAVHLNICNQNLNRAGTTFKSPEEHYDYAVSLSNSGDYEGARGHLEKLQKQHPNADYVWYGLAALDALQGRAMEAMKNLEQAIRLNPANRIQARNDTDFQGLFDDPRFTELLYPEATGEALGGPRGGSVPRT
ncbi:MAG TPA: tetratricopeptide repeat protein [Terriglobales bacterium]|nr:tetratricopeptide repeat protein [Terriglobales bacterium]